MSVPSFFANLFGVARAVRPVRLAWLLAAVVLAGLASDWARDEQRLIFPRPLPSLVITPAQP